MTRYWAHMRNNTVVNVIVADSVEIATGKYGKKPDFVETFKGLNFAGKGYTYNKDIKLFTPPKPFKSWVYNKKINYYVAPTPIPRKYKNLKVKWNENMLNWELLNVKNI